MRNRAFWLWPSFVAAALSLAPAASAVNIEWVAVGDPGNACDPQSQGCFGAVSYDYQISKYEITNAQYAEFLNAKARSDPLFLFGRENLSSSSPGLTRSGSSGSYTYSAIVGRENKPVGYVTFYDALRFANWLHNGQGSGDTETGAYTLLGGTETPSNATTVTRNPYATIVLPSDDEWYKAAYYDSLSMSYFEYPAGSDAVIACALPSGTPNSANCGEVGDYTNVGSYTGSAGPYGTFDQGGNVAEWKETIVGFRRGWRGGARYSDASMLAASSGGFGQSPYVSSADLGFRVAMVFPVIPEPNTALLMMTALLGLAYRQRRHGRAA